MARRTVIAVGFLLVAAPCLAEQDPDRAERRPASERPREEHLIADRKLLEERVKAPIEQGPGYLTPEERRVLREIGRTRGTYQSYLLYTAPGLPMPLFHPGFTITLPPPRKHRRPEPPAPAEGPLSPRSAAAVSSR